MTRKAFYTDPLAAAWMLRHHGMGFNVSSGVAENIKHIRIWDEITDYYRPGNKFYIHPDSLHLLEPQVGDLVSVNNGQDAGIAFHQDFIDALKTNYTSFAHQVTIIQRNGIAFMWAEFEE